MDYAITQDDTTTHVTWRHIGVTASMIDWFWSNMDKGFVLWHPQEHRPLSWAIPPKHGNPIGAVHIAPQTWSDGVFQNLYIRFEDLGEVPDLVKACIEYEHCIVVAGLGFGPESLEVKEPLGYRVHQWQKSDEGVIGKASAFGVRKKETRADGMVWAKHCAVEVANWGVFLPSLYQLYRVVTNTDYNPFADLSVVGKGQAARYSHIQRTGTQPERK